MYCELNPLGTSWGTIEHIKPKSVSEYQHLCYEWANLGFSCSVCNKNKDVHVDCINPYEVDPNDYLMPLGAFMYYKNAEGKQTRDRLGLNRAELLEARFERIREVRTLIFLRRGANDATREQIKMWVIGMCDNSKPLSLFLKEASSEIFEEEASQIQENDQ